MNQKQFTYISWFSLALILGLVTYAWGSQIQWDIGSINAYQWFPLFGLIAWSVMAEHYYLGALRLTFTDLRRPAWFKEVTEYLVLASLLLHPGLLAYEQFKNDQGLPPESFASFVGDDLKLFTMLGTVSLLVFLSYEVLQRMKNSETIKKKWWVVSVLQSLAMVFIWVHALKLGSHLGDGWFQAVWVALGIGLLPSFYIVLKYDFRDFDS